MPLTGKNETTLAAISNRLLHEPLLYFALLGGAIFALLGEAPPPERAGQGNRLVISGAEVDRMAEAWVEKWQRPPSDDELGGMIAEAVREQVLYREALALGLDQGDVVISRHLRQKYEFVTQDLAYDTNPDEATLRAFHAAQPDRYARPARLSFSHILFSPERRGEAAMTDAVQTMAELQSATGPQAADLHGDPTSLPQAFEAASNNDIEAMFGPEFATALQGVETGRWVGPIASGYGLHLIWLAQRVPGEMIAFDDIRQRVKDDWVYEQRIAANEAVYRNLLSRYEVVVEPRGLPSSAAQGGP